LPCLGEAHFQNPTDKRRQIKRFVLSQPDAESVCKELAQGAMRRQDRRQMVHEGSASLMRLVDDRQLKSNLSLARPTNSADGQFEPAPA